MKKFFRLYAALFLLLTTGWAQLPLNQQQYADSLTRILQTRVTDSVKARVCFALLVYWTPRDTTKARQYLEQGRIAGTKSPFLRALSYAQEGYLYYATDAGRSEAAFLKADTLLSVFPTKDAYAARSSLWANVAALQQRKDDDKAYINIVLTKTIPLGWLARDTALVASQYVGVGTALMNIQQYGKAELYLNKAIALLSSIHTQPSRLAAAYNRAGENYMLQKKMPEARRVLDTLKILLQPYPESELNAGYYMIEGLYYHEKKLFNLALESFDKGIAAAGGPNKAYRIQELQFYKIASFIAGHKYAQALQLLNELAADEELMSMDDSRAEIYADRAAVYAGMGEIDAAYTWQKRYSELSDSLHESRLKDAISELEIQFQDREKKKEIAILRSKGEQAELAAKNNRLLIGLLTAAFLLLFTVAVFALLYFRNKRKLSEQQEINYRQEMKEMMQNQQLVTTEAMLEGEERERRRMARDLHDGLGSMLAGIKIKLSGQAKRETANHPELDNAILQLDNSVTELRRIARNMMPESLVRFGLQTALKDLCESLMNGATRISFEAYDIDTAIDLSKQIVIYRIIQEALSNAIRHAAASHILLQCSQNENTFFITVEDDGIGFDQAVLTTKKGIGMSNIENRVKYLKGRMDIASTPGEGTTINIELNVAS